ncbi:T9SS type B sorting domain-containing protein [Flavobacterium sp.]|uniref:T9SS type B sorting domain-containing protein n=1 Tax=Flavobacterium sp. TaxID=239 RepID=UPI003526CF52
MYLKRIFFIITILFTIQSNGQLGFCNGSLGEPIFLENFGSGTDYGPALPNGITNYNYVSSGFPDDGEYTLYYRTNLIPNSVNWHYSLDRTPDNEPNGTNGKCLIVNASYTSGQFYRREVTNLCSATRFEFSAWLLNIYNASSGACSGSGIPINVTFEIWNASETTLLESGSTGNINGSSSPNWNQYGLVFTMPAGESSVILKMRNNGSGGCGNDLAIDDIMFRACGEASTVVNATGNTSMVICENTTLNNTTLQVNSSGTQTLFYQWQISTNNIDFTAITGATNSFYIIPNTPSITTYYRAIVAQDPSVLNNSFCSTISDVFTLFVNPEPPVPQSNGDQYLCTNTATTTLSVTTPTNVGVNWYDSPTNGNLVVANSNQLTTSLIGTYYAESFDYATGCTNNNRIAVTLFPPVEVSPIPDFTICSGEQVNIPLTSTINSVSFTWNGSGSNTTGFSNGTGTVIADTLSNTSENIGYVYYTIIPIFNGCEGNSYTLTITVSPNVTRDVEFYSLETNYCINSIPQVLPLQSENTSPITGSWTPSNIDTSILGVSIYTFTPNSQNCETIAPYVLEVTVEEAFSPNFEDTLTICKGSEVPSLNSISPNGITGNWSPSSIDNQNSGTYLFTPNSQACFSNHTLTVTVTEPVSTLFTYTYIHSFSNYTTITLNPQDSTGDFLYQIDDLETQDSPVFNTVIPGVHKFTVYDKKGCGIPSTQFITSIGFPSFFTPNGDGFNDTWQIKDVNLFDEWKIFIFDRYGKLLKELHRNSESWDGTFNGKNLPANDYWFVIEYKWNEKNNQFKSHFSLKR